MKIFGREPLLVTSFVAALLALVAAFGFDWLSAGQATVLAGAVVAAVAAFTTRPWQPGVFTGLVSAGIAVLLAYGVHVPDAVTAGVTAVVLTGYALIARNQASPVETPVTKS